MFVAGVDGCRGGWIAFKVELSAHATSVEVVNLPAWLRERPPDLACVGIDIPIGLLECPRACDKAARKLLGQPRQRLPCARPPRIRSADLCRGKLYQSAEEGEGAEPASMGHCAQDQVGG